MGYKKYKKARKAKVEAQVCSYFIYSITCPFCHTVLVNTFNDNSIRTKCTQCNNEIILEFDE